MPKGVILIIVSVICFVSIAMFSGVINSNEDFDSLKTNDVEYNLDQIEHMQLK